MAATPEAKAKAKVKKLLTLYGVFHFAPVTSGYGSSGIPDIICCYYGRFFAIEVKADTAVTALQQLAMDKIVAAGGVAFVVRINSKVTEGYAELENYLLKLRNEHVEKIGG